MIFAKRTGLATLRMVLALLVGSFTLLQCVLANADNFSLTDYEITNHIGEQMLIGVRDILVVQAQYGDRRPCLAKMKEQSEILSSQFYELANLLSISIKMKDPEDVSVVNEVIRLQLKRIFPVVDNAKKIMTVQASECSTGMAGEIRRRQLGLIGSAEFTVGELSRSHRVKGKKDPF